MDFFFFFCLCDFPVAQTIKNLPAFQESQVGKIPWRREQNPLQSSCLENPMDRGSWQVQSVGLQTARHN